MDTTVPDGAHTHGGTPTKELSLATVAFSVCFYAWALLGPLGPDLQDQLGLTDGELALTISIPVLLGSLMRIPLGCSPTATAARGLHPADGVHTGAADRPRAVQRLLGRGARLRPPARVRRRLVRGRSAVRQPLVPAGAPGVCAWDLRHRDGWDRPRSADGARDRRRDQHRRTVLDRRRCRARWPPRSGCSPRTRPARPAPPPARCSPRCPRSGVAAAAAPGR